MPLWQRQEIQEVLWQELTLRVAQTVPSRPHCGTGEIVVINEIVSRYIRALRKKEAV